MDIGKIRAAIESAELGIQETLEKLMDEIDMEVSSVKVSTWRYKAKRWSSRADIKIRITIK